MEVWLDSGVWLTTAAILVLIICSGFFSGSETAITASSPARLLQADRQGHRGAKSLRKLMERPDRLISALLLGNNLVNILASALATSLFLRLFPENGVAFATITMTLLVLIFAEVLPKTYSLRYPDRVALALSRPLSVIIFFLAPIAVGISRLVTVIIALITGNNQDSQGPEAHEELRGAIDLHHEQGGFVKQDRDMLGGVLDLKDLELSDIMVHRTKMTAFDITENSSDLIEKILQSPYTRIPLYEGDPDNIICVLHARDLLRATVSAGGSAEGIDIRALATKPWFVPESTSVTEQLKEFLRRKAHIAFVVDEYGEVMGLVTLEDIIEEIVGDIADEYDPAQSGIKQQADGSYILDGSLPIRDVNRVCDWSLPDDEANTIAGLIIHEAKAIPNQGQAFLFHGFRFQILRKQRNRLTSIRVKQV